jgi:hypothetical protein
MGNSLLDRVYCEDSLANNMKNSLDVSAVRPQKKPSPKDWDWVKKKMR